MDEPQGVTRAVQCLGCDAGCEVYVEMRNGQPVCLGGNNCPTGAQFACAQCKSTTAHESFGNCALRITNNE